MKIVWLNEINTIALDSMDRAIIEKTLKDVSSGMITEDEPECIDEEAWPGWDVTVDLFFQDGEVAGIMIDKIKID